MTITTMKKKSCTLLLALLSLTMLSGCAEMGFGMGSNQEEQPVAEPPRSEPYYPTEFKDLLIPAELSWKRENSMTINNASFTGGILNFTGRVEVTSLTNFFLNSMHNNGWQLTGSVQSKNVLLAFLKPEQTCMIRIFEGEFGLKTDVYVYITKAAK